MSRLRITTAWAGRMSRLRQPPSTTHSRLPPLVRPVSPTRHPHPHSRHPRRAHLLAGERLAMGRRTTPENTMSADADDFDWSEVPYWKCRYYLTCDNPSVPTEPCSIGGCYSEPACITDQPIGGWPIDKAADR